MPPRAGDVVASTYRIVKPLARGGMGTVYEAEHLAQRRRVALKWVGAASDSRVVREGTAATRARHPNVVEVLDVVVDAGEAFLAMELLRGEPLSECFRRGPMHPSELLPLLLPAMRAMATIHARGVLHRDISPANLFVAHGVAGGEPVLKILDFGLAKLCDGVHCAADAPPGRTYGTPVYMSREQVLHFDDVDERADVYGFGAVLYEGLAGRAPFQADGVGELILQVLSKTPPSIRESNPAISWEFDHIVMLALQKDREWRLRSVDALVRALEPLVGETLLSHPRRASARVHRVSRSRARAASNAAAKPSVRSPREARAALTRTLEVAVVGGDTTLAVAQLAP